MGLKSDNYWSSSTCPSKNPLIYNNKASAGNSYFRINITADLTVLDVWNRDCGTGKYFSMRNGLVQCWACYVAEASAPTPNSIKTGIKNIQKTMSSPQDLSIIKWLILAKMNDSGITQAALVMDGLRNANCSTADTMRLSSCQFPKGFTMIDSTNPNLNIFTFVDAPSYDVAKNCVVMYFDANDTDLTGKIDYSSCTSSKAANGFAIRYSVNLT
ncbi:unnamed protein product [Caenorhabditis angaria]|uniref:Uncharacterized protein n=1 Tax=Caenorhabditis angaria TaxID=860376 RepID=A0A9P1IM02_9PELO|nr:unnamed protein product [Caenorhabditis angaria]